MSQKELTITKDTCPFCKSNHVTKAGYTNAGSRRYKCVDCEKRYVIDDKYQGYEREKIDKAIVMRLNGYSLRTIADYLGVNHQTVSNWTSSYSTGVVYLLKCEDRYKIGKTAQIKARVEAIEREIGQAVELIHLISSKDYGVIERLLHDMFLPKQIEGEWFRLDDADVAYIATL